MKDGVHLAQLPVRFGEQVSESARPASDAHIVWQDTNTVEPMKRQCVAESHHRIRSIIERQDELAAGPRHPVELLHTRDELATRSEVVEGRVGDDHIERPVGERKRAHVSARHRHAVGLRLRHMRGDAREVYPYHEPRSLLQLTAESASRCFIEKVGLEKSPDRRVGKPAVHQISIDLVGMLSPEAVGTRLSPVLGDLIPVLASGSTILHGTD